MQNHTSKRVQIDWIKDKIRQGKQRAEFLQEFTVKFNLVERTLDNRLVIAKSELDEELRTKRIAQEKDLEKDETWQQTKRNMIKSEQLIYDSISYMILRNQKKVDIGGVEQTVLDIPLERAGAVKQLWEIVRLGQGKPTQFDKNEVTNVETVMKTIYQDLDLDKLSYDELELLEALRQKSIYDGSNVNGNKETESKDESA